MTFLRCFDAFENTFLRTVDDIGVPGVVVASFVIVAVACPLAAFSSNLDVYILPNPHTCVIQISHRIENNGL